MDFIQQHSGIFGVIAIAIGLAFLIPAMLSGFSEHPDDDKPKSTSSKYVAGFIFLIAGLLILLR